MSELESIFSEGRDFKIGKSVVKIKNISLGDLPVLLGAVSKFMEAGNKKGQTTEAIAMKIFTEDFDSVVKIFEAATDLEADVVKKLNVAAGVKIMVEIIKDNLAFFSQHVVPALKELQEKSAGLNKSKS